MNEQGQALKGLELAMAESTTAPDSDALNEELQAMRSVARQLERLPGDTQSRVVAWLTSRYASGFYKQGIGGLHAR